MPVTKPTAIGVLLEGIRQAKSLSAPRETVENLEEELILEALILLLGTQNQTNN